ncbi:AGAP008813-PA-like protein [Anopheles sinensis]|uniref:AGAP008813-PA-like protein n=1 Tax=Anopheles sinensis TaxID=74873 RepID=A0A084WBH1_ANOSI|nr:AGAP008813-PA-like protein [Anopheles sinensis]
MEQPRYASRPIYDVMLLCWSENPNLRPTFDKLAMVFNAMLPKELQDHYMALNDPFMQANNARANNQY